MQQTLREKIVIEYNDIDNINFENETEYFGGLPRIDYKDWPFQNEVPGTHLLSIELHEPVIDDSKSFIGMAIFFHLECRHENAYSLVKFSDNKFAEKPTGAMLMPQGRIVRVPISAEACLDYSFIAQEPVMRSGPYKGDAFLAQLTNDILPFPSERATFYIDINHPPFWQI